MKHPLTMFVSSTCYDLSQIRKDIKTLYDPVGIRVLLSDDADFPVLPGGTNQEACYQNVIDSDIYILIIGKRSGYVTNNGRSITNNEYILALEKNMPIYCFIDKSIMALFAVYRANKDKGIIIPGIDNLLLFEFAIAVYDNPKVWSYGYESVAEIQSTLAKQLPILLGDALRIRKSMTSDVSEIEKYGLGAKAARIVIDRPVIWEYALFSILLDEEVTKCSEMRIDHDLGVSIDVSGYCYGREAFEWFKGQIGCMEHMISPLKRLFSPEVQESAFGPKGKPGNIGRIVYLARSLGKVYRSAILWSLRIRAMVTDSEFDTAKAHLAKLSDGVVLSFEKFVQEFSASISIVKESLEKGESPGPVSLSWTLTVDDQTQQDFLRELEIAFRAIVSRENS